MNDFTRECRKVERHWKLALTIDALLLVLIVGPIWATVHTSTVEAWTAALVWWPWVAAWMVGLALYYMVCDDNESLRLIADLPRLLLYALILMITSPWWLSKVREYEKGQK